MPAVGDFVPMGDLTVGTELRGLNGEAVVVVAVHTRAATVTVYNFEVVETHTYFVAAIDGGMAVGVHNAPCGGPFYRGGFDLTPGPGEVRYIDKNTGLLKPTHGISLNTNPDKVARFGGAYEVVSVPHGLKIQQRGIDTGHYEIMPSVPMYFDEYVYLLKKVILKLMQ